MTIRNNKKHIDNKGTIGSVVAGVAGTVAIAGVAVAATMALQDEKNRKKVNKVLIKAKDQAIDYVESLKTEQNSKDGERSIKEVIEDTK